MEIFSVDIELNHQKFFLISMVYKPPSTHLDEFTDAFNELLDKAPNGVSHIVMGDFDLNLLDLSSQNGDFLNSMIANDLYPLVNIPTRITRSICFDY